ncbi:MAG TPA: ATP-binding protein, partial [Polyangia bacterium]|nr:ATP-binding protein [Polyangia bacterium]
IKLRWGAIAGQIVTILGVARVVGVELPLPSLFAVIAIELVSNIVCVAAARRRTPPEWWCGLVMTLDVLLLTALLHLTGGPFNPFSFLYLVEIALAAVILRARWTWTLVLVSLVGSGALFVGPREALTSRGDHMQLHLRGMWVAFGVAATFIVYFLMRVRRDLEARELDLVAAQRRGARQERLASLATLAAGAAHELATPLGTIALAAKELERRLGSLADADAIEDVQLIRAQVSRCRGILDSMAAEAGQSAGEPARDVPVADLLRLAVDGLRAEPPIEVDVSALTRGQRLCVPPRAVAQAVKSLLKNAQDASQTHTPVQLSASCTSSEVHIEVLDRGSGMAEPVLARAGEPFFTTKEPGRGMGLGLFLTRTVVEQLGGQLALSPRQGGGTRALVTLPATAATLSPAKNDRIGAPPVV